VRVHFDVLGWLHSLAGVLSALTGAALCVIALGAVVSVGEMSDTTRGFVPGVVLLVVAGVLLVASGFLCMAIGQALRRRLSVGRHAAILAAVPSLLVIPFGTALALYTFWTLINDDARRAFGRPVRASNATD
jgi:hypothetical protein